MPNRIYRHLRMSTNLSKNINVVMVTYNQFKTMAVSKSISFQNSAKKYYTSTGKCHRFIPSVSQEFDCRVKSNIKPELKYIDLDIKNEEFKTIYCQQYPRKIILGERVSQPPGHESLKYLRPVGEKLVSEPVRPIPYPISETKDSYQLNYVETNVEEVKAPVQLAKCNLSAPGREQQPAVSAHKKGFWRWTDPYLTTNRADYTGAGDDKIAVETLTFYNAPKFDLPAPSGNKTMFDKAVFNNVLPLRLQARPQKRVPNFGLQSEYQDHFIKQTFSITHPYLHDNCTEFEDSLPLASSWQTQTAPGMYCTEYCTIGRGSVRRTIDQSASKIEIKRTPDCCRLYG